MSSLSRELVFLTLQFLDEEKFKKTLHKLEQESGFFFNMKYFEDEVQNGNWDEVEKYLSGFTKVDDNRYSMKIFFEIRKQKYLEALDKHDRPRAVDILVNDLKVFALYNEDLFKEITLLLTLENFRENQQLSEYGDAKSARAIMLVELKKLIEANPLFHDKLQFPNLKNSRLRTLINQSLNWQHQLCKNPRPNPDIKTLFTDHSCSLPSGVYVPSLVSSPLSKLGNFPSLGTHMPFQPSPAPVPVPPAGWMSNPPAFPVGAIGLGTPTVPATILNQVKMPQTSNLTIKHSSTDSDFASKRTWSIGITDKSQLSHMTNELPKTVARTLNQGSSPMSMDFHPTLHTLLLVGTSVGDIGIWDVGTREKLVHRNFKVWDITACTMSLQIVLDKDPIISVSRIKWSPDGSLFGVAYSRHIVQIYSYQGSDAIRQQLEIDAHVGGVNDIAFAQPEKQLCVITCGDDKLIKVWDTVSGTKQYTFEGHEAPVYSVCPQYKENVQFIFSTSVDGKIKAWLYDDIGPRIDYDAPGHWCTTMAYSADGSRLFSCGTSNEGHSYLVEWNECEGDVKRTYNGFHKRSLGVVQFDTTKNRFLAAGDEFVIKVWDMDSVNLLTTIDADGGLRASPLVRFNKEGSLMAVSAHENVIKILANEDGLCLLRTSENHPCDSSKTVTENITKLITNSMAAVSAGTTPEVMDKASLSAAIIGMNGDCGNLMYIKPRISEEMTDKSNIQKLTENNVLTQCRSLRLMGNVIPCKISRLMYANSGAGILALASNATHFLWKLPRSHPVLKATVYVTPKVWQPSSGIFMKNDISITNPGESVSCFALSKNDCYVISASGGTISLFNMATFERMTTFMPSPPAATSLAFHPEDNNIIAIGMDDSTIHVYNVNVDEVKTKFSGHSKRITGLAFSSFLHVLVSSGADSQINVWGTDGWNKLRSKALQIPSGRSPTTKSDLQVQFHRNQIHFLAVHETQIALYDANDLDCMEQWIPGEGYTPISHAAFSCDCQLVYACFVDATVCVFDASNLKLKCRIDPTSYLPANDSLKISATVIAAHPLERNQIAVGLTDGSVHILEPLELKGNWGASADNGSACSSQLAESSTSQN